MIVAKQFNHCHIDKETNTESCQLYDGTWAEPYMVVSLKGSSDEYNLVTEKPTNQETEK